MWPPGGSCAASAARTSACTLVELAEITDQLLEKGQLAAGRWRRPSYWRNFLAVLQAFVIDGFDDPLIVEVNDIDLLVDYIGVKEGKLASSPTDVVPRFLVEDTDA